MIGIGDWDEGGIGDSDWKLGLGIWIGDWDWRLVVNFGCDVLVVTFWL